jgi:hypothetical protein
MATLCDGSAACATVQVLQVLPWEDSPSLTCLHSVLIVPVPASFVGLEDCLAFSCWPLTRSLLDHSSSRWEVDLRAPGVPGWLATFDSCNRNGAPSAGASLCPADRLVWSCFSISTVSPFVSRVRLDTLLPRKRGLLCASTGTQRCVEFPLAFLYHANAPAMYLPRVRQGDARLFLVQIDLTTYTVRASILPATQTASCRSFK